MRERFERELKVLAEEILKMGLMVERALGKAMNALKSADTDAADSIVAADRDIDEMEAKIEGLCAMIIAREQPVAGDLRDVLTAQKISSELERMGDHARSLAKRTGKLGIGELAIAMPFFDSMLDRILTMNRQTLEAFTEHDPSKALDAAGLDHNVDRIHDELYERLMDSLMTGEGNPETVVPLLFLNRFLERLGDRVTNMCEWIYYAGTGERMEMNTQNRL